jgi:hypothetical protein
MNKDQWVAFLHRTHRTLTVRCTVTLNPQVLSPASSFVHPSLQVLLPTRSVHSVGSTRSLSSFHPLIL